MILYMCKKHRRKRATVFNSEPIRQFIGVTMN